MEKVAIVFCAGTINKKCKIDSVEDFIFLHGAREGLRKLNDVGYQLLLITTFVSDSKHIGMLLQNDLSLYGISNVTVADIEGIDASVNDDLKDTSEIIFISSEKNNFKLIEVPTYATKILVYQESLDEESDDFVRVKGGILDAANLIETLISTSKSISSMKDRIKGFIEKWAN